MARTHLFIFSVACVTLLLLQAAAAETCPCWDDGRDLGSAPRPPPQIVSIKNASPCNKGLRLLPNGTTESAASKGRLICRDHALIYHFKFYVQNQRGGHYNLTDFPIFVVPSGKLQGDAELSYLLERPHLCLDEFFCWTRQSDLHISLHVSREYDAFPLTQASDGFIPFETYMKQTPVSELGSRIAGADEDAEILLDGGFCTPRLKTRGRNGPSPPPGLYKRPKFDCPQIVLGVQERNASVPLNIDLDAGVACDLSMADALPDRVFNVSASPYEALFPGNVNEECRTWIQCNKCNGTETSVIEAINLGPACRVFSVTRKPNSFVDLELQSSRGNHVHLSTFQNGGSVVHAMDSKLRIVLRSVSSQNRPFSQIESMRGGNIVICGEIPTRVGRAPRNPWGCGNHDGRAVPTKTFMEAWGNPFNGDTQPFWLWLPKGRLSDDGSPFTGEHCGKFGIDQLRHFRRSTTAQQLLDVCYKNFTQCLARLTPCEVNVLMNKYSLGSPMDEDDMPFLPPSNLWNKRCGGMWVERYTMAPDAISDIENPGISLYSETWVRSNQQVTEVDVVVEVSDLLMTREGDTSLPVLGVPGDPSLVREWKGRPVYQLYMDRQASTCYVAMDTADDLEHTGHCHIRLCNNKRRAGPQILEPLPQHYIVHISCDEEVGVISNSQRAVKIMNPQHAIQNFWVNSGGPTGTCNSTQFGFELKNTESFAGRTFPGFLGQCNITVFDGEGIVQMGLPHVLDVLLHKVAKADVNVSLKHASKTGSWASLLEAPFDEDDAKDKHGRISALSTIIILSVVGFLIGVIMYYIGYARVQMQKVKLS